MEAAPSWLPLLAALATVLSAAVGGIIAVRAIETNRQIARLRATLDLIERTESKKEYTELSNRFRVARQRNFDGLAQPKEGEQKALRDDVFLFLIHYEMVAIGIKSGILDETLYAQFKRGIVVRDWRAVRAFIESLRPRADNPNPQKVFEHFEHLARAWEWEIHHEERLRSQHFSEEQIARAISSYRSNPSLIRPDG